MTQKKLSYSILLEAKWKRIICQGDQDMPRSPCHAQVSLSCLGLHGMSGSPWHVWVSLACLGLTGIYFFFIWRQAEFCTTNIFRVMICQRFIYENCKWNFFQIYMILSRINKGAYLCFFKRENTRKHVD